MPRGHSRTRTYRGQNQGAKGGILYSRGPAPRGGGGREKRAVLVGVTHTKHAAIELSRARSKRSAANLKKKKEVSLQPIKTLGWHGNPAETMRSLYRGLG